MTTRVSTSNVDALSSFANPLPKQNQALRRGTWTAEEEQYVAALIEEFKHGHLPLKEGMSLRCFLAKMVHCNPKRISKKFEGSNYNGKQLYEQNEKELDAEEAQVRREKLQELELKFEDSVTALKSAEDSRQTGVSQSMAGSMAGGAMGHFPHRQMLPGAAGLAGPGVLNTEANWLRGSLGVQGRNIAPFGMAGMTGFPSLAGAFDPALFQGYVDPMGPSGLNAGALRDMVRLADYGRNDLSGESNLGKNGHPNQGMATKAASQDYERNLASLGYGAGSSSTPVMGGPATRGFPQGANFPTLPNMSSANMQITQDMLLQQQQLTQSQEQLFHENATRRRLMNLLSSQPAPMGGGQMKRSSLAEGGSAEESKKRRMC